MPNINLRLASNTPPQGACRICLEEFNAFDAIFSCSGHFNDSLADHLFHDQCTWTHLLDHDSRCPVCRRQVDQIIRTFAA